MSLTAAPWRSRWVANEWRKPGELTCGSGSPLRRIRLIRIRLIEVGTIGRRAIDGSQQREHLPPRQRPWQSFQRIDPGRVDLLVEGHAQDPFSLGSSQIGSVLIRKQTVTFA